MSRRRTTRIQAALVAASLLLAACSAEPAKPRRPHSLAAPPPIVLITIDTIRADHLGCYGYHRDTSPRMDQLASESLVFDGALATMSTTLPTHLSILTGLYPHQHGYEKNLGSDYGPFRSIVGRESVTTMLKADGYTTAAFTSGPTINELTGIGADFDVYDGVQTEPRLGRRTVRRAIRWLEEGPREPFFLWVHLWDPHEPNEPEDEYLAMFPTDDGVRQLVRDRRLTVEDIHTGSPKRHIALQFYPKHLEDIFERKGFEIPQLTEEDLFDMFNRYDADVRYTDDCVGRLIDKLKRLGYWDKSIVILAGDHGQSLGQHGWLNHGTLTQPNIHIPMMIRFPDEAGVAPRRMDVRASQVDLMATALARFDSRATDNFLLQAEGEDLLAEDFDRPFGFSQRTVRERKGWVEGRQYALISGRWKFVRSVDEEDFLFDLEADPGELVNVADQHPDLVEKYGRAIEAMLERRPFVGEHGTITGEQADELMKMMERLGYTDGSDD